MWLKYLRSVLRHKWFVFVEACKLGIPWLGLIHDLSKFAPCEFVAYARNFYDSGSPNDHDHSAAFDAAWNAHQKHNKHHWQYWVLLNDNSDRTDWAVQEHNPGAPPVLALNGEGLLTMDRVNGDDAIYTETNRRLDRVVALLNKPDPLPMPERYIREMVADWRGAGRAYGNPDTIGWYEAHKDKQIMHPRTRRRVEELLMEAVL